MELEQVKRWAGEMKLYYKSLKFKCVTLFALLFPRGNHIIRNKMHFQTCKYMDVNLANIPFDDEELNKKDLS